MKIARNKMKFLGGFAGGNRGKIKRCGSIGQMVITGENPQYVGGFVGQGAYDSGIHNCYAQVTIKLTGALGNIVGGFLGNLKYLTVTDYSYCSSPMEIADDCQNVGAFIGYAGDKTSVDRETEQKTNIRYCFWDTDVDAPKEAAGTRIAEGMTLKPASREQLTDMGFLQEAGWDVGPSEEKNIWVLTPGELPRSHRE